MVLVQRICARSVHVCSLIRVHDKCSWRGRRRERFGAGTRVLWKQQWSLMRLPCPIRMLLFSFSKLHIHNTGYTFRIPQRFISSCANEQKKVANTMDPSLLQEPSRKGRAVAGARTNQ